MLGAGRRITSYNVCYTKLLRLYAPTGGKHNSLDDMGEEVVASIAAAREWNLVVKPHDHPKNSETDWASYLRRYESDHCRIAPPRENVT